jgi:hypothetical protein
MENNTTNYRILLEGEGIFLSEEGLKIILEEVEKPTLENLISAILNV